MEINEVVKFCARTSKDAEKTHGMRISRLEINNVSLCNNSYISCDRNSPKSMVYFLHIYVSL